LWDYIWYRQDIGPWLTLHLIMLSSTTTSSSTPASNIPNDDKDFWKGNKQDASQCPILKDERLYDRWHCTVINLAKTHQVIDVLHDTYVPATDEEKLLFEDKQQFMFNVLDVCLQTDMGLTLVHKHYKTNDAQKVWQELTTYMKASTKAEHSANELLAWLTTAKYDSTWRGPLQGCVLYWINRMKDYDSYCEDADNRFTPKHKLKMLQCSFDGIADLRQVCINAAHNRQTGHSPMTFQQYVPLLLSAPEAYDISLKLRKGIRNIVKPSKLTWCIPTSQIMTLNHHTTLSTHSLLMLPIPNLRYSLVR
jgi:hypothetical protein